MNKQISFFALIFMVSFIFFSFSFIQSESTQFEPFSGISLNIGADVYLSQGETHNVRIEADEDVKSKIITEVKDNVLIIKCDKSLHSSKDIKIYVTMKELNLIELNGSGDIVCQDSFNSDNLAVEVNGSGDITLSG